MKLQTLCQVKENETPKATYCMILFIQNMQTLLFSCVKLCPTLCNPMHCSTPGFPVLTAAQTHVHRVSDAIQPTHPLSSPSPPAFNLSQHQGLKIERSVLPKGWGWGRAGQRMVDGHRVSSGGWKWSGIRQRWLGYHSVGELNCPL